MKTLTIDNILQGLDYFAKRISLPTHDQEGWSMSFKERVCFNSFANSLADAIGESSVCWITDGMGISHPAHFEAEWAKIRPQVFQAIKRFEKTGKIQEIKFS